MSKAVALIANPHFVAGTRRPWAARQAQRWGAREDCTNIKFDHQT